MTKKFDDGNQRADYVIWLGDGTAHICDTSSPMMEYSIQEGMKIVKIFRNMTFDEAGQAYNEYFNFGPYEPMADRKLGE